MRGTILIVDDAETSGAVLEMACSSISGVEICVVCSARKAVRMLEDGSDIRAVITDLQMPGMDGFELIRFIRSDTRYERLPVIVVTADTDPDTPGRARRLGANAFFTKPCSPAAVRQKLERLLEVGASSA